MVWSYILKDNSGHCVGRVDYWKARVKAGSPVLTGSGRSMQGNASVADRGGRSGGVGNWEILGIM